MYPVLIVAAMALAVLFYSFGFVSTKMGLFPSTYLDDAWRAARAYKEAWEESRTPPAFVSNVDASSLEGSVPVIRSLGETPSDGQSDLILMQGGWYRLTSHCPDYGCLAWIMDRDGEILHTWPIKENVPWERLENVGGFATFENIYPTGLQLLDNGDLIVAYHGRNTFPFGIGLARIDRNGDLVWRSDRGVHHWIDLGDDGLIYAPAHRLLDSPIRIGETNNMLRCEDGRIYEDLVLVYDLDGNVLEEISIHDAMVDSGYVGLVRNTVEPCDPLHLNHVEVLDADRADEFPPAKAGDLLVSLLSLDAVALIDRDTHAVTWVDVGKTIAQHNALFYENGKIIVFDNQGGNYRHGGSRIVTIDMGTGALDTIYPTDDVPPDDRFYSSRAGHFVLSDDNQKLLMSLTMDGIVFEIDLEAGRILWEYDNIFDMTQNPETAENGNLGDFARFQTGGAYYVGQPAFLDIARRAGNDYVKNE